MYLVDVTQKGKKTNIDSITCKATGKTVTSMFEGYTCYQDYIDANVVWVEPMTAKEPLNDAELEKMLTSEEYIAEEKLDGTRCTKHLGSINRLFSRRVSKKTDWFAENSDSVPHLRDFPTPSHLYNTTLDGEMRIDGREFKDVSSTLNCKWDEAIYRQSTLGYITFHAFDIVYYKGVYVAKMPLRKRKELLKKVVEELNNPYVKEEFYTTNTKEITLTDRQVRDLVYSELGSKYINLYNALLNTISVEGLEEADCLGADLDMNIVVDKKAWYDYILMTNGEGLMLKSLEGTYKHTRGREYTKWKKFDTWDVVVLGFEEPTEEYTGKELDTWQYWGMYRQGNLEEIIEGEEPSPYTRDHHVEPVTKHFAKGWIGTVKYGVIITDTELQAWKKINPNDKPEVIELNGISYLVVGECSGMDESTRQYMTDNKDNLIETVIEVGANEILKTGKLRHPRFIRFRTDKEAERCIWRDHKR